MCVEKKEEPGKPRKRDATRTRGVALLLGVVIVRVGELVHSIHPTRTFFTLMTVSDRGYVRVRAMYKYEQNTATTDLLRPLGTPKKRPQGKARGLSCILAICLRFTIHEHSDHTYYFVPS